MTQLFVPFDKAKSKLWNGTIQANSHVFHAVLSNATNLSNAYAGTSNNCQYSDFANTEVIGPGYTPGGMTVTVSAIQSGPNAVLTYGGLNIAQATLTATAVILIDNSATNRDAVAYSYLDLAGGTAPVSPANGPLQHWANSGISQY